VQDAKAHGNKNNAQMKRLLEGAPKRVIVAYTYPRLDMEVSKKMNHLLKAPFCVHPKTGKARRAAPHRQSLRAQRPCRWNTNQRLMPGRALHEARWEASAPAGLRAHCRR
jgi:DNA primase catalytic subunit